MGDRYKIERMTDWFKATPEEQKYCRDCAMRLGVHHPDIDWKWFDIGAYARDNYLLLCKRDDEIKGLLLYRVVKGVFDPNLKSVYQDLLYAEPNSRAAYLLLKEFIDFGKRNAHHIISMIGSTTNIKGRSLERLGFRQLENVYRLEV